MSIILILSLIHKSFYQHSSFTGEMCSCEIVQKFSCPFLTQSIHISVAPMQCSLQELLFSLFQHFLLTQSISPWSLQLTGGLPLTLGAYLNFNFKYFLCKFSISLILFTCPKHIKVLCFTLSTTPHSTSVALSSTSGTEHKTIIINFNLKNYQS